MQPDAPLSPLSIILDQNELNFELIPCPECRLLSFPSLLVKGALFSVTGDLKPTSKATAQRGTDQTCGSNHNTVSSRELGGAMWKWAGKDFSCCCFCMKDSVDSEGEPLSFTAIIFSQIVVFPTQSATTYQVVHIYFIFPLFPLECLPGTRHWAKLNKLILLFYLPVTP